MVAVQGDAAFDDHTSVLVEFIPGMIDQEVSVDLPGKFDQCRNHLHPRADGIQDLRTPVQIFPGMEDIIHHHRNARR